MAARAEQLKRSREAMSNYRQQTRSNYAPNPGQSPPQGGGQPPELSGLAPLIAPLFGGQHPLGQRLQQRMASANMAGAVPSPLGTSKEYLDAIPANAMDRARPGFPASYPPEIGAVDRGGPYTPGPGHLAYPNMPQPGPSEMPQDYRFSEEAWRRSEQGDNLLELEEEEEYQRQLRGGQNRPVVRRAGGQMPPRLKRNRMRLLNMLRGKPVAPLPKPPPRPVAPGV
jgi:hypothetical protein